MIRSRCLKRLPTIALAIGLAFKFIFFALNSPDQILPWLCFWLWMLAEYSSLPPVAQAKKRGALMPGENSLPWVHSFVAAVARTSYFFQLDIVPLDLGFGGIIALAIAGYTALVAMIVAKESEQDKIAAWIWLGVMIPNILRWLFPIDASGVYYVAVIALNRTSLWAGIPGAWQSRDGRWFTDTTMLVFNLVCSFLWITYGIVINNVYLALNSMFAVIFIVPCLILKVILLPRFCGKITNENAENKSAPKDITPQSSETNGKIVEMTQNIRNRKLTRSASNQFAPPEGYEPAPMLSVAIGEVTGLSAGSIFSSASGFIDTMVENLGPGIPSIGLTTAGFAGPISIEMDSSTDFTDSSANNENLQSLESSQASYNHESKPEPLSTTMGDSSASTFERNLLSEHHNTSLLPVSEHQEHIIDMPSFGESPSETFGYSSSTTTEVTAAHSPDIARDQGSEEEDKVSRANLDERSTVETVIRSPLFHFQAASDSVERTQPSELSLDFHLEERNTPNTLKSNGDEEEPKEDGEFTRSQLAKDEHLLTMNLETFPMSPEVPPGHGDSIKELLPKTSNALPKDFFVEPYEMI